MIGIYLRRQLGLRLLLLCYNGEANRTPQCVPWDQLLWQNPSCLPYAAMPTEVGAIEHLLMGDALEHTTFTDGVVEIAINGDIMRNIIQIKNIYHVNFQWLTKGIPIKE